MHVLVTGATGFVGRSLCARLHAENHCFTVVSRAPAQAHQRLPDAVAALSWEDLGKPGALDGIQAVVHLAGETVNGRWNDAKRERVRQSRLSTTRALVNAIQNAEAAPEVMLCASGIGYYGEGGETELSEDAPSGDDYFAQLCVEWEAHAQEAQAFGVRVVQARLGIVLGVGGGAVGAMLRPARMGLGGPLGPGTQWWSWIHLEDAVSALCHLMVSPEVSGPVNLVAPQPVRQRDFAKCLGAVLGRPAFMPAPAFALKIVLGTFSQEILASKRVKPNVLCASGFTHRFPELRDALVDVLGPASHASVLLPVIAAGTLGLAPYQPEPHVWEKVRWLVDGAQGMAPIDWLDLLMHGAPWAWLCWVLVLYIGARFARPVDL